jgi:hypothetical protein
MSPKDYQARQDQLKLMQAQAEFVLAIKKAKSKGVNVSAIFLEVREQVMLAWVRCFGLMVSIFLVVAAPLVPPLFQVFCFKVGMPYHLSEIYYYWPFLVGVISMVGFGFNLVNPKTLQRITGKPTLADNEHRLSESGHFIINDQEGADGDV